MQTQNQLKASIYTALYNDATLTNNIYWIGRPTVGGFPCIVYYTIDTFGGYAFCGKQSETVQFQIDIYTDPSEMNQMDNYTEAIKTVMEGLGYRLIGSPAEFLETDINKIMRASRWEIINV